MLSPEILVFIQVIKSELMNEKNSEVYPVDFKVLQKSFGFTASVRFYTSFFKKVTNTNCQVQ
ncbi:MAG: hypothetical protein ACJAZY_002229 [Spirosomataceae bacterium]|jgi:hypothetical protein